MAPHVVITWVGQSSFQVQLDGVNLATDPIWSDRPGPLVLPGPKRRVPSDIPFDALPPIDEVLLSHNHFDHLDDRTVRRLVRRYPEAAWLTPLGVASFVRARGATRVVDLDWWEETSLGAMRLACTPAQHFSVRGLRDRGRALWCVAKAMQQQDGPRVTVQCNGVRTENCSIGAWRVRLAPRARCGAVRPAPVRQRGRSDQRQPTEQQRGNVTEGVHPD
ncbi:MAG: MBL fold metallo-hydrolase [Gemmatimonadaceae bacterium]|nr:MBL fold metallo-hydrolase [Gemmatimonadaceae bacterium]